MAAKWLHKQIMTLKEKGPVSAEDLENISLKLDLTPLSVTKLVNHKPRLNTVKQRGVA